MTDVGQNAILPKGWTAATIASVTQDVASCDPRSQPVAAFNYVDISSIDNKRLVVCETKRLLGKEAPSRARRPIKAGDVIFSNVRTYLRNVARVDNVPEPAIASTGFTVLRPTDAIITGFLFRYVASDAFLELVTPHQTGTHYPATSDKVVRQQAIPVPPAAEQRRIAERLDEIDICRLSTESHLVTAQRIIERCRRAVLAAACSGRLTKDWREDRGISEWQTFSARDVCAKVQSGTTPKQWYEGTDGIPFLKVYNIVDQQLAFASRPQYIAPSLHRGVMRRAAALPGDVLMNIVGPPLGKVAIVTDDYPEWSVNQALTLFRPSDLVTTEWLYVYLCGGTSVSEIIDKTRGTVGQINISLSQCREFQIPVPSLDEQAEVVRRASDLIATTDRLAARIDSIAGTLDRASKAAVSKAFRGELVLTEAALADNESRSFESADELLARIESATTATPQQRRRVAG